MSLLTAGGPRPKNSGLIDVFEPVFGYCQICGVVGTHLIWDYAATIGTFACKEHLAQMQKRNPRGRTERM
jgi:hypothetical protein